MGVIVLVDTSAGRVVFTSTYVEFSHNFGIDELKERAREYIMQKWGAMAGRLVVHSTG